MTDSVPDNTDFIHHGDVAPIVADIIANDSTIVEGVVNSPVLVEVLNSKFSSVVRPEKYGATSYGNGPNDPTINRIAFQAAIDEASGVGNPALVTRQANKRVEFSGRFDLDGPIYIKSVIGLEFVGVGYAELRLTQNADTFVDINGAAYSHFGNFTLKGEAGVQVNIALITYWDVIYAARSNTRNMYYNIIINNFDYVTGFMVGKFGTGAVQVDNDEFRNITITGNWVSGELIRYQYGLYVGNGAAGNNLVHHLYHATIGRNRYGIYVNSSQISVFGVGFDSNEVDFFAGMTGFSSLSGVRGENSERFIVTGGPSSIVLLLSVDDVLWSADNINPDLKYINFVEGGILSCRCLQVKNATVAPIINLGVGLNEVKGIFDGLSVRGTGAPYDVQSLFTKTAYASIVVKGYAACMPSGSVVSITDWDSLTPAALYQVDVFNIGGTWIKPLWAKIVKLYCRSATSGAGSGRRGLAGTVRCGGGGSGGASWAMVEYDAEDIPPQLYVTIGIKGIGGAAVLIDDTNGNPGTVGTLSSIRDSQAGTSYFVNSSPGVLGAGGTNATGLLGAGGTGQIAGGPGASASATGLVGVAAINFSGCAGGGSGAGISAANAVSAGGNGGQSLTRFNRNYPLGGAVGQPGQSSLESGVPILTNSCGLGHGAGGGGSILGANGGNGGNGIDGGGAGGGAASENGFPSGKGGDGCDGKVVIICFA